MSIQNSIGNLRKPIGEGWFRRAYYSKKYNCVIKIPKAGYGRNQSHAEADMFSRIADEDKIFFPYIDFIGHHKHGIVVLMHKMEVLFTEGSIMDGNWMEDYPDCSIRNSLQEIIKKYNLVNFDVDHFINTIRKYHLQDVRDVNLGIYNGNIVFIDIGYQ